MDLLLPPRCSIIKSSPESNIGNPDLGLRLMMKEGERQCILY